MRTLRGLAWAAFALTAAGTTASVWPQQPARVVTIAIDPARTYQTFQAWGATASYLRNLNYVSQQTLDQMTEEAVNDLGLTFLRLGFGYLAEPFNDNGDPRTIDWSRFLDKGTIDRAGALGLVAFARKVEANGERPVFLLNKDWGDSQPGWMSDGEYAEHVSATILYHRDRLGIPIAFTSIDNEPRNHDSYTPARQRGLIKALGQAFAHFGLPTKVAVNEGINPKSTWDDIRAMQGDRGVWPHVGLLNYHLYGNVHEPYRSQIRDFGLARGIPTGQTEYNAGIKELVADLTLGGVSYWTRYHLTDAGGGRNATGAGNWFVANHDATSFARNREYWRVRQFTRYVRPGSVRLDATSSAAEVKAFAFRRTDGRMVAIAVNDVPRPARVTVRGLPPGRYAVSQGVSSGYREMGVHTVDASGAIDVAAPVHGVVTIALYDGRNQPPVMTSWRAAPAFVTRPADAITLSASAQDVEAERLSMRWRIVRQPVGARVTLAAPGAAETRATGLSVPGEYVFAVTARDASGAETSREVFVRGYDGNQPPVIAEGHRYYRDGWLVDRSTSTYGPLYIHAFDLEDDPVTMSFSVVSQPAGARARFDGTRVSGLTRSGTYVFRFTVRDPTHEVSREFTQIVADRWPR